MISEKIALVGWYNESTKQFENLYREKYVNELKQEILQLNFIIECYILQIEELMQIILEQPTEDKENDKWLLSKLNSIKKIKELKEEGKNE